MHVSEGCRCGRLSLRGLSNPRRSSCRREDGAAFAERVLATSWMRRYSICFKADRFRETCLSFDIASLLLMWALKPRDRASAVLSGEFVQETLITVDGELRSTAREGMAGWARALRGADGEEGSRALSPSCPEGGRPVGPGSGLWAPAFCLGPCNVFHIDRL